MIEYIINDMKTFFISLLATCTFVFFAWRIKRFGLLEYIEDKYLSFEKRSMIFILRILPVLIPILMVSFFGYLMFHALLKTSTEYQYYAYVWLLVVWFFGPIFERDRIGYNFINKFYQRLLSSNEACIAFPLKSE